MSYAFYYKVIYYLDSEQPENSEHGFLLAADYAEAAKIIDKVYDVIKMEIKMIGDGPCVRIPNTIENFDIAEWEEANGF